MINKKTKIVSNRNAIENAIEQVKYLIFLSRCYGNGNIYATGNGGDNKVTGVSYVVTTSNEYEPLMQWLLSWANWIRKRVLINRVIDLYENT